MLFVGGRRDHGLVLAVDDRRHRKRDLQPGEVALYTDAGQSLLLKADGTIEVGGGSHAAGGAGHRASDRARRDLDSARRPRPPHAHGPAGRRRQRAFERRRDEGCADDRLGFRVGEDVSDIALRWDPALFAADLAIEANDLASDEGLKTAVVLSLFTDRRAEEGDALPDGSTDRRGWWGDAFPVATDDRIGSRLWLLSREKQAATVLSRAEEYAREALQWLLDDRVAERIAVTVENPRAGMLGLEVVIYRPQADPVTYRFDRIWETEGVATPAPAPRGFVTDSEGNPITDSGHDTVRA